MTDELRMGAYYYGFDPTGVREIDMILSAVACAGKAFHHTQDWSDESKWPPHEGKTPIDWIQNAANAAAAAIRSAERAARAHERERCAKLADAAAVEADSPGGWIAPNGLPHAAPCTLRQFAAAIRALPEAAP